jgi:hypothetical protein
MESDRKPEPLTDEETRKLADEFGLLEDELAHRFNVVRSQLVKKIRDYFAGTDRRTIIGESYTISARERPFWHFADRPAAVRILANAGLLEMVFQPENAALADILDEPDLPDTARRELEKLAERKTTWKLKVESRESRVED